jgi:hypothetical protein
MAGEGDGLEAAVLATTVGEGSAGVVLGSEEPVHPAIRTAIAVTRVRRGPEATAFLRVIHITRSPLPARNVGHGMPQARGCEAERPGVGSVRIRDREVATFVVVRRASVRVPIR